MALENNRTNPDLGRTDTRTGTGDSNPDPITKSPGAHPVGVGVGSAGAGAAGAAIGAVGGPIGAVVGAVVGAVAGGLAGKGVAEAVNPTEEDAYWRENFKTRPYASGSTYEEYSPAYRYGWESSSRYPNRSFSEAEGDLRSGWEHTKDRAKMDWDKAKNAVRDAWDRTTSRRSTSSTSGVATTGSSTSMPGRDSRLSDDDVALNPDNRSDLNRTGGSASSSGLGGNDSLRR